METRDEYKRREQAWITYIAPNLNPKKMKKNINHFWKIGNDKRGGPTKQMIETMKKVTEQYHKDLENGRGQK